VLILGNICTRNCKFCAVGHGKPLPPDATEPERVAQMAKEMGLKYLVITSVDRDDLTDGGAGHFRDVILRCGEVVPELEFELLVPDFRDSQEESIYQRSLTLLEKAKQTLPNTQTKSSLMLGLGEKDDELMQVLKDLRTIGCDRLALGQYLRPGKESLEVVEYIPPEKFDWWADQAKALGFTWVQSSPFTRSSYHAEEK